MGTRQGNRTIYRTAQSLGRDSTRHPLLRPVDRPSWTGSYRPLSPRLCLAVVAKFANDLTPLAAGSAKRVIPQQRSEWRLEPRLARLARRLAVI